MDVLFPVECLGCEAPGLYLCDVCSELCVYTEPDLVCPLCLKNSPVGTRHFRCQTATSIDGIFAAGNFRNDLLHLAVKKLKYKNIKELAGPLAGFLCKKLKENFSYFIEREKPLITFVPLSPSRIRERGYNQSELLAQKIAETLGCDIRELLIKTRETESQALLAREERLKNLKGSFAIKNKEALSGRAIFIVDDVTTTGETLRQCAYVLKKNGARIVWGIAVAKE